MKKLANLLFSIIITTVLTFTLNEKVIVQDISLNVGDTAPEFVATSDEVELWRSEDHIGNKILVVYFYPAAMTGGCTA